MPVVSQHFFTHFSLLLPPLPSPVRSSLESLLSVANSLSFSIVCAIVAADALAVHGVVAAFGATSAPCPTQQPMSLPPWAPADQVSASTAISSFSSPQLSRGTSGGLRFYVDPLLTVGVPAVGLFLPAACHHFFTETEHLLLSCQLSPLCSHSLICDNHNE